LFSGFDGIADDSTSGYAHGLGHAPDRVADRGAINSRHQGSTDIFGLLVIFCTESVCLHKLAFGDLKFEN
jgi:hypothetical protein